MATDSPARSWNEPSRSASVAFGAEALAQLLAADAWKTYAAPTRLSAPGAPMTAVVPSAERATLTLEVGPGTIRLAVGLELVVHEAGDDTWKRRAPPWRWSAAVVPTNAVVPSADSAPDTPTPVLSGASLS